MTTTAALSSQSVGTGSNKGENLTFSTATMRKTAETATTAFTIEAKLTNGASFYNPGTRVTVWYASSGFAITYSDAPSILRSGARYVELIPSPRALDYRIRAGDIVTVNGQYLYCWVDSGGTELAVAQTLDINFIELP